MKTSLILVAGGVLAAADPARVSAIRGTGIAFMAFGLAYLVYRYFRDR